MQVEKTHTPLPNTSIGKGTANSLFSCYILFEKDNSLKSNGAERKTLTYVLSHICGDFSPIEALKDKNGNIIFYWQRNDKGNKKSTAETRLQCKDSINFSSIYLVSNKENTIIGYGEPPKEERFKNGKINPFFRNKEDGYIFIISNNYQNIEILVVQNNRNLIVQYAKKLQNGDYDNVLEHLRKKPNSL